jgi:hypothetical protein
MLLNRAHLAAMSKTDQSCSRGLSTGEITLYVIKKPEKQQQEGKHRAEEMTKAK